MTTPRTGHCPFEKIATNETEQIDEITELTVELQKQRYPEGTRALRGVHPKSHGCVRASFVVHGDLAPEHQVGLFATPSKHFDAWVRYSNADTQVRPDVTDGERGSRGMAIKVLNVGADVIEVDHGSNNQDFLMINQPVFAFPNTEEYLKLTRVLHEHNDNPDAFFKTLPAVGKKAKTDPLSLTESEQHLLASFKIIQGIQKTPAEDDSHPLAMQYFSAAPFLFGSDRLMKFSVRPINPPDISQSDSESNDNFLRDALTKTMGQTTPVEYEFLIQVATFSDDLNIENASSLWDSNLYPFIPVAKITIDAPQDVSGSANNTDHCEPMSFTPWHCLSQHQPVGSINRLRRSVYAASTTHRLNHRAD